MDLYPSSPLPPPPPPRNVHLWGILALPAMNGPLPAELNFEENTVSALRTVYMVAKTPNFI